MVTASDSLYYKHSGHVGLVGPMLMVVFGAASGLIAEVDVAALDGVA